MIGLVDIMAKCIQSVKLKKLNVTVTQPLKAGKDTYSIPQYYDIKNLRRYL